MYWSFADVYLWLRPGLKKSYAKFVFIVHREVNPPREEIHHPNV